MTEQTNAPTTGEVIEAPSDTEGADEVTSLVAPSSLHHVTPASPLPLHSGAEMAQAFEAYHHLQAVLDASLTNSTIQIKGKLFRKKAYWRAIATSFGLTVEVVSEERIEHDVTDSDADVDWGYHVVYRAIAPSGRSTTGDGSCMRSEKISEEKGDSMATDHNVRGHAHTRAFNRAVSNLVGFGEVSAEEVQHERRTSSATTGYDVSTDERRITDPQRKRLYAIAKKHERDIDDIKMMLEAEYGYADSTEIQRKHYEGIITWIETDTEDAFAPLSQNEMP